MDFYEYEADVYSEPDFPVYFSVNTLNNGPEDRYLHWHEAVEFLYCAEGGGVAVSDTERISLSAGNLAVINANRLHTFYATEFCRYYYMLVSPELASSCDLPGTPVQPFIADPEVELQFQEIIRVMRTQPPFYRSEALARITQLYVHLYRYYPEAPQALSPASCVRKRLDLVKEVIAYVRRHFTEPITVDDVCRAVTFSRSYVCHAFKEVTGQTLVEYINYVRCNYARTLLATNRYNVSECAEKSGFNTLSYFSKLYKKHMGVPPSEHR